MTTQEVADKLVSLCREGKYDEDRKEKGVQDGIGR